MGKRVDSKKHKTLTYFWYTQKVKILGCEFCPDPLPKDMRKQSLVVNESVFAFFLRSLVSALLDCFCWDNISGKMAKIHLYPKGDMEHSSTLSPRQTTSSRLACTWSTTCWPSTVEGKNGWPQAEKVSPVRNCRCQVTFLFTSLSDFETHVFLEVPKRGPPWFCMHFLHQVICDSFTRFN